MTGLTDRDRTQDVRDEAQAVDRPEELQDRELRPNTDYDGTDDDGGTDSDSTAYQDRTDAAEYQDRTDGSAYQDETDGSAHQDGTDPAAYQDGTDAAAYQDGTDAAAYQDRTDGSTYPDGTQAPYQDQDRPGPDALGTDEEVLTRDPEAGLDASAAGERSEAEVRDEARRGDADVRPDGDGSPDGSVRSDSTTIGNGNLAPVAEPEVLLARWQEVQTRFVDDPQETLRSADELVQQVMKQVEDQFAAERSSMEQQWSRGEDVSTEDLRLMLQRYRSFFNRLLSV